MLRFVLAFVTFVKTCCLFAQTFAQTSGDSISVNSLEKHVRFLASDSLKGRGNYTPELKQCADYIAEVYQKLGLQKLEQCKDYFQAFAFKKSLKKLKDTSQTGLSKNELLNVVGVLPGKSKPGEVIIFSAHYDHLGMSGSSKKKWIYNGANDNASGVAALLGLAEYYALKHDNERTIIFCAFSGEEIGLLGSEAFAKVFNNESIKTVINFDMVGLKQGARSFFITGANRSNLAQIIKSNIPKGKADIRQEPPEEKQFYERSDNYSFAQKGVVAHSIMTTDDYDPCYHKPCDDIERIDFNNLKEVLEAVVLGCATIINGKDTPR